MTPSSLKAESIRLLRRSTDMKTDLSVLAQRIEEETGHYAGGPLRDFEKVGRHTLLQLIAGHPDSTISRVTSPPPTSRVKIQVEPDCFESYGQ